MTTVGLKSGTYFYTKNAQDILDGVPHQRVCTRRARHYTASVKVKVAYSTLAMSLDGVATH